MANIMRWRYGERNPVTLPVDSATDIEIGDMIWLDGESDTAKPASDVKVSFDDSLLPNLQKGFKACFVGVAMQRSRAGDTQAIRIATSGVFEFDCDEQSHDLGDRVGAADEGARQHDRVISLADQRVSGVPQNSPQRSIGRVAKRVATADTKVLVEINSTVMRKGALESETPCVETNTERPELESVAADDDDKATTLTGTIMSASFRGVGIPTGQMILEIRVPYAEVSAGECTVTMKR